MTVMRRRRTAAAIGVTAVLALTTACGGAADSEDDDAPIKVGVPLGLTGPAAATGDWARMGVELAVKQINADGGIDGRQVKPIYADTELDPTKAVTVVNRLINKDEVDLIVGPMTSDETLSTLPMTTKANIASINGSGSEITPEVAPLSFGMLMNAEDQAERMVQYAVEKYDADSVGLLTYGGTQGKAAAKSFKSTLDEMDVELVGHQEFNIPANDLTSQLLDLKNAKPDVLLSFHQTGDDTGRLVLGTRAQNWNVPVIGSYGSTFAAQTIGVAGDDAYEGLKSVTWSAFSACSPDTIRPETADFIDAVNENFSEERTANAAYDYVAVYRDALFLLKAGVEGSGSTEGDKVTNWLETKGAEAAPDLPLVHEGYAMSADNHFLMNTDSLTLTDPGEELAPEVVRRLDCE